MMAPFASLEHPNAKLLFRLYKAVNPDDARGALAEWCRRMPGILGWLFVQSVVLVARHRLTCGTATGSPLTDLEFGARYALTKPTRHGRVWARLHKLRVQNPVLVFGDRAR